MKTVLALDPGYLGTRTGICRSGPPREGCPGTADPAGLRIDVRMVPPGEDPFEPAEAALGSPPSIVAVPGGPLGPCRTRAERETRPLNAELAEEAQRVYAWHPLNRAIAAAHRYCARRGVPGIVVRPMSSADLLPEARLSGHKECERRGDFYAVPQRAAFAKAADTLGIPRETARLIAVYLGEEVAVSSYVGGAVVDTSDPVACEGPFGFTSMGTPPATGFVSWAAAQKRPADDLRAELKERSGAFAYAGATDLDSLREALASGNEGAVRGIAGMAYQVSKEIGRQMAALRGTARCVALCGPGASLEPLVSDISRRVAKWCEVIVLREDLIMQSLVAEGILALS